MANFIESAISVIQAMVVGSIYIAIFYGKNPISGQNSDCDIEDDSVSYNNSTIKYLEHLYMISTLTLCMHIIVLSQ